MEQPWEKKWNRFIITEDKTPPKDQLSKMKDKLEKLVNSSDDASDAVAKYLKSNPKDKQWKSALLKLADPMF